MSRLPLTTSLSGMGGGPGAGTMRAVPPVPSPHEGGAGHMRSDCGAASACAATSVAMKTGRTRRMLEPKCRVALPAQQARPEQRPQADGQEDTEHVPDRHERRLDFRAMQPVGESGHSAGEQAGG